MAGLPGIDRRSGGRGSFGRPLVPALGSLSFPFSFSSSFSFFFFSFLTFFFFPEFGSAL